MPRLRRKVLIPAGGPVDADLFRRDSDLSISTPVRFFRHYIRDPNVVGAIAPSSRSLARAICESIRHGNGPLKVLEVGAGTGSFTRRLGAMLTDDDELDIYEVQADFAGILERDVLSDAQFAPRVALGRVRLFQAPIQELNAQGHYDYVISGLPLNSFELSTVQEVFTLIRRALKPGGIFSYFEYACFRRFLRMCSYGGTRKRVGEVSAYLSEMIRTHQIARRTVLLNFPPAHTRHLCFEAQPGNG